MKRKIGEIYNKPIVTGDKNLVTKNEVHESSLKEGGGDVNKKYGYYRISPDVFDFLNEDKTSIIALCMEMSAFVAIIEVNGRTSFNRIDGVDGYKNFPTTTAIVLYLQKPDNLPYCSRNYFNLGIMVDESDSNPLLIINNNNFDIFPKGTLLERLEQVGSSSLVNLFTPITKEEYENLSNDFKEAEL